MTCDFLSKKSTKTALAIAHAQVCYDQWLNLTHMRTNVMAVVEHLTQCIDVQFPELVRDRHVFSFRNGVYLAAADRFVEYGTPEAALALPPDLAAARYFGDPFDVHAELAPDDWYAIPTPHLQQILDFQVTFFDRSAALRPATKRSTKGHACFVRRTCPRTCADGCTSCWGASSTR